MSGPTRYTTSSRQMDPPTGVVDWLLKQPATWVGIVVFFAVGSVTHSPLPHAGILAGIAAGLTLALSLYYRHLSIVARLRRAMAESGLVFRFQNGVVQEPKLKGLPRHIGRNARLRWEMPPGISLRDVLNRQEAIEQRAVCELVCWMEEGILTMEVLRHRIPDRVDFSDFYKGPRPFGRLLIGLGRGRRGALWTDLATLPHLLVGGLTGGGKSVFIRQALTHIALEYKPTDVKVVLIDLKGGVELARFAAAPHTLGAVVDSIGSAATALGNVRQELDDRLRDLRRVNLVDIDSWLEHRMQPHWPRIVVVVDELAELTIRDLGHDKDARAAQQAALGRLTEIARLGRSVGIHLLLCTQRPDADAVPGQLKANLPGTVAFRVRSGVNSLILLDTDRATQLAHIPGRGLWACERIEEFQSIYVGEDECDRLIAERWHGAGDDGPTVHVSQWGQTPQSTPEQASAADADDNPANWECQ